MSPKGGNILRRLRISDARFVEIETKRKLFSEQLDSVREFLMKKKGVRHRKSAFFFDQFLDTPRMDFFRRGASLRLRYKKNASRVYLQYKGPGFHRNGALFRSEFSTKSLDDITMEESHHDIIRFTESTIRDIVRKRLPPEMSEAMRRHIGPHSLRRISTGNLI